MSITDVLLETSRADTDLLLKNDARGDKFSIPRDVDFLLCTSDRNRAEIAASFINDNRYGSAKVQEAADGFEVLIIINMPVEQNVLCGISGLMACIAQFFGLRYDGWGCVIQSGT